MRGKGREGFLSAHSVYRVRVSANEDTLEEPPPWAGLCGDTAAWKRDCIDTLAGCAAFFLVHRWWNASAPVLELCPRTFCSLQLLERNPCATRGEKGTFSSERAPGTAWLSGMAEPAPRSPAGVWLSPTMTLRAQMPQRLPPGGDLLQGPVSSPRMGTRAGWTTPLGTQTGGLDTGSSGLAG